MEAKSESASAHSADRASEARQRLSTTVLILPLGSAILVTLCTVYFQFFTSPEPETLTNSAEWPEYLQHVDAELQKVHGQQRRLEVQLLSGRPIGIFSEFRARVEDTTDGESMNVLKTVMGLHAHEFDSFMQRSSSAEGPGWWPKHTKQVQYFVCDEIHKGVESHQAIVASDPATHMIYMTYSFDF